MIKYSVIIPVYNAEKTIKQCVESLICQSFKDIEIILIDDGSKDTSLSVCNALKDSDNRVKVIRKENGGVSSARNIGISVASGKYITFVDSDDYVSKDYFKIIDNNIQDDELLSFAYFSDVIKNNGKREITLSGIDKRFIEKKCDSRSFKDFFINSFFASPWNKVYERDIILENNINFDTECVCYEDLIFNLDYVKYIKKVKIIQDALYYYRTSENENPILKRKWGEPFSISKKLVKKIKEVCDIEKYNSLLSTLLLYSYTAFITELKYLYLVKKDFKENLKKIVRDKDFIFTFTNIKNAGKKFFIIKVLLNLRFYFAVRIIVRRLVK